MARVGVAPEREQEYLATLARLARLVRARGEHLWLFRHPVEPGRFLEFSEGGPAHPLRDGSSTEPEESALERRLHTIASYDPGARARWEEVQLEDG